MQVILTACIPLCVCTTENKKTKQQTTKPIAQNKKYSDALFSRQQHTYAYSYLGNAASVSDKTRRAAGTEFHTTAVETTNALSSEHYCSPGTIVSAASDLRWRLLATHEYSAHSSTRYAHTNPFKCLYTVLAQLNHDYADGQADSEDHPALESRD